MTTTTESNEPRLAVSRQKAAQALDCSVDHIDDLVARGELEKVVLGTRKVAIRWRSMLRLIDRGVTA